MELIYLYLLPVTVALAWIVAFVAAGRYRQLNDKILIAFLAVGGSAVFVSQRIILYGIQDSLYRVFIAMAMLIELSICPLLYLYIHSVTKDAGWHNRYLWLFSPAVLFCFAGFFITSLDVYYLVIEAMTVVLMAISIYDLVKYHKHSEDFFANLEDSSTDKMRNILVSAILLLLSMFLLSSFAQDLSGDDEGMLIVRSLWFAAMLWLIACNGYRIVLTEKQLEVLMMENDDDDDDKDEDDDVDDDDDDDSELAKRVKAWQQRQDKPYCKEGITVVEVARQMDVSPRALSSFIHENTGINFNQWINAMRIEEAKRLLRTQPEQKITYISALCGYATPSAFTRAFTRIENQSPLSYRDSMNTGKKSKPVYIKA